MDPDRATYSIDYVVSIRREEPLLAHVRWNLAGVEEITRLRIELDGKRFFHFRGSGDVQVHENDVEWRPAGPYGHLEYTVRLRHRRSEGKGFDSYSGRGWVITRAQDLFPRHHLSYEEDDAIPRPRSRSTVEFRLPRGWNAWSAMEEVAPFRFRPDRTSGVLDRPKGWIGLGRLQEISRRVGDLAVTVVTPRGSGFDGRGALRVYERTLPTVVDLLAAPAPRFLVVSGPDPMWRGGLSGERSLFLHSDRPLRTPDQTAPPLHEAFHVFAPFSPAKDGRWVTEGLAEFYSLELQHRAGLLSDEDRRKGLRLFLRYGKWRTNLAIDHSLAVTNNSAPAVIAALDELIRRSSHGEKSIDDAVRDLARTGGRLSTARFLRAASQAAGSDVTAFFQRHVYAGEPPKLASLEVDAPEKGANEDPTPRA